MMVDAVHRLHLGVAEAGKLLALKGRHTQALAKYREALRLAHGARAPQLFARHYLHCVLESLEHLGAYTHAAELAGAAADSAANPDPTPFQKRDRAHLLERQGVNLARAGDVVTARAVLAAALELDAGLPLARALLEWTARGLAINPARLAAAQRQHGYWVVRPGTVDAARAAESPIPATETSHG
jgi:tetratricopeptide (TPR) repeat protein